MPEDEQDRLWLSKANDAISINLVAPSRDGFRSVAVFHPAFTYPIFGEEEEIFGYQNLRINLRYRTNDMRPHLKVSWGKRLDSSEDREVPDIRQVLEEGGHLPKVAFVNATDFEDGSKQMGNRWTPPGVFHSASEGPDGTYEVWRGTLADNAIAQLHRRVQIMVPFFIEGGSYVGLKRDSDPVTFDYSDGDRWTVFFLYRKQKSPDNLEGALYTFVGYSTVYRFFYFQPASVPSPSEDWELPNGDYDLTKSSCRTRLSQFIILPPFQGKGNGVRLYDAIFNLYHKNPQTQQFTVEDPNEAFDDLRDLCDLRFLRTIPEFDKLKIDTSVSIPKTGPVPKLVTGAEQLTKIREKAKISPRQFSRVLEMHLMSQLPQSVQMTMNLDEKPKATKTEAHQHRAWQLVVKQRLYRQNREILAQIPIEERIDKLAETLIGVELEYARLLAAFEKAKQYYQAANGKRKLVGSEGESCSKKARVEDL